MMIAVLANDEQWKQLNQHASSINLIRIENLHQEIPSIDAYIILQETNRLHLENIQKPVLLNAVINTLKDLQTNDNIIRINGWNVFLSRAVWEISGVVNDTVKQIFTALNKQYIEVKDEPGLVAARVIAMIINEAYFALGEKVSSKEEIDTAMKLGTSYPFGPFEWANLIGIKNIYDLLMALNSGDKRYLPAPLLQKEATA